MVDGFRGMELFESIDSPPNQSQNLRQLSQIEQQLTTILLEQSASAQQKHVEFPKDRVDHLVADLWRFALDVVFFPLWLRLRAIEILNVCFGFFFNGLGSTASPTRCWWFVSSEFQDPQLKPSEELAPSATVQSLYHSFQTNYHSHRSVRSILSTACQTLEEMEDASKREQDEKLLALFEFLQSILITCPSAMLQHVFEHAVFMRLVTKMMRLLGICSQELFAEITTTFALFHCHESHLQLPYKHVGEGDQDQSQRQKPPILFLSKSSSYICKPLVQLISEAHEGGQEHFAGALLHVINSCGFPNCCVDFWKRSNFRNCCNLLLEVLQTSSASQQLVYGNDLKVLVDVFLRELENLPLQETLRVNCLQIVQAMLQNVPDQFRVIQKYRGMEILKLLESLLDHASSQVQEDKEEQQVNSDSSHWTTERLPQQVVELCQAILLQHIDLLD